MKQGRGREKIPFDKFKAESDVKIKMWDIKLKALQELNESPIEDLLVDNKFGEQEESYQILAIIAKEKQDNGEGQITEEQEKILARMEEEKPKNMTLLQWKKKKLGQRKQ